MKFNPQIKRYEAFGIPVFLMGGMELIPEAIKFALKLQGERK